MEKNKNNAVEKVENIIRKKHGEDFLTDENKKAFREDQAIKAAEDNSRKEKEKEEQRKEKERIKEEKEEEKIKKKKNSKGKNKGLIAAIVGLSVIAVALAVSLTCVHLLPNENEKTLEAGYQKSFRETVDQVKNIDLNLSKILATEDSGSRQYYLVNTAINSELAENDLQQLPLSDESKFYTTKLINQIGDFSKYLNKKLIDGKNFSAEDINGLKQLYSANLSLKNSFEKMLSDMPEDFNFLSLSNAQTGNIVIDNFNELQNLSVEYPELIYDGPFSDGLDNKVIKGLTDSKVDEETAKKSFTDAFSDMGIKSIKYVGKTNAIITCFNFTAKVKGKELYAQISERDGKLIMFDYSGSCRNDSLDSAEAIDNADKFLTKLGLNNMQAVWINLSGNVYTINYAYTINDIVIYPDMIKIRVCAETGMVIGFEASAYYINHTERNIGSPAISTESAESYVSKSIELETARLSLVPVGNESEILCYEFSGIMDGNTYYIYIDAANGKQVQMFKVIESTEGLLLM